jgi:threonine/homoserine/homoserine lactone efflux protein
METLLPLIGFVLVSTFTPGPNNLMCLTSGANFGLARTIPHIAGISVGFPIMIVAVGLGLGYVFDAWPVTHVILQWLALAYMLWLAWRIVQAGRPEAERTDARPLTVFEAAAFQLVNPKAWAIIFGATALYTTANGNRALEIGLIALLFGLICFPNGVVWALFGRAIAGFLQDDRRRFWFNVVMAVLLVVSVLPTMF